MIWLWIGFVALVLTLLVLDLFVVNRKAETVSVRKAMGFTGLTVFLALCFAAAVYWMYDTNFMGIASHDARTGSEATAKFLNAWVIEYALSLDNILVIALIFRYFKIPPRNQHRVLFWGILGALVMRGVMIGVGTALVQQFHWILYVFGAVLIYTAIKLLVADEEHLDPDQTIAARLARKFFPISDELDGQKFFTRRSGRLEATRLFLVLVVIEGTDVIFAVDSIPAAFAITSDPFLVFTSNIFAILGLRSLYFALAAVIDRFKYLKLALVFVLAFIGVKMLISHWVKIPPEISLAVVVGMLATGVGASLFTMKSSDKPDSIPADDTHAHPRPASTALDTPPNADPDPAHAGSSHPPPQGRPDAESAATRSDP
jgi:tellurite resistance protein TerC